MDALEKSEIIINENLPKITSIARTQLILNSERYRTNERISHVFSIANCTESYDSRKTHYGQVDQNSFAKILNIYSRGIKLFNICPIICFPDGGIEFLSGFGGESTEQPSYICILQPSNGAIPIKYWKTIGNKKLIEIIQS